MLTRVIKFGRRLPLLQQSGEIIGMNRCLPSRTMRFFSGQTCMATPLLIYEIYGTIGMTGPRKRGHIDN